MSLNKSDFLNNKNISYNKEVFHISVSPEFVSYKQVSLYISVYYSLETTVILNK